MSNLKDNYLNEDQKKLVSAFTEVLKRENKPIKESINKLETGQAKIEKDIKEIKDNHLKHIDLRLNKLETDASQTDLRLSNLEKGQKEIKELVQKN